MRFDVADALMNDLQRDFGLSREQAAGVVGNLAHESMGFMELQERNPTVKGSRGGFGYAQWTGSRRRDFEGYAKSRGLALDSYEANYGFLSHELKTTERKALNAVKGTKNIADAASVFERKFERPGIPHSAARVAAARSVYDNFGSKAVTQGGPLGPIAANVPTPTRRPGGLLDDPSVMAASRVPTGLLATQPATKGGRVSNLGLLSEARPRTGNVPTPTSRNVTAPPATLGQRLAGPNLSRDWGPNPAPQALLDRYAETRPGVKGGRVAPSTAVASRSGLTPEQEQNIAGRIGTIEPTRTVQPSRAAQFGQMAAGLLGVSPAAASELPPGARPNTAGFAGVLGSPRAAMSAGLLDGIAPQTNVPTPTAAPRPAPITTTRVIADSPRVAQPQRTAVATPTARPTQATAQAAPSRSYAPQAAPTATPVDDRRKERSRTAGQIAGGVLGGAVAGPVGGLLGSAVGGRIAGGAQTGERSPYDAPSRNLAQMGILGGSTLLGAAIGGPIGGLLGGYVGNRLVTNGVGNGGYAGNLPSAPGRVTERQARELERSLAERRSGGEGPSMSRETRDSISSGRAGGGLF